MSCRPARTARAGRLDVEDVATGRIDTLRVDGIVAASGRFTVPQIPAELRFGDGVEVLHSSAYRGPARFAGRRVLVVGNSISGLEIASDLAHDPTITVVSSSRRPRWIVPKLTAGVPADHVGFTAFAALLGRTLPARGARGRAARAAARRGPATRRRSEGSRRRTTSWPRA